MGMAMTTNDDVDVSGCSSQLLVARIPKVGEADDFIATVFVTQF